MRFLDRVVAGIAPAAGLRRAQARAALDVLAHYRAGDLHHRVESVRATRGDADAVALSARRNLALLSRDMVRNNPLARRAVQVIENNVVGAGIEPRLITGDAGLQREWQDTVLPYLQTVEIDGDGVSTLAGLQSLALAATVTDGEVLIVWPDRAGRGARLRVVESDYLDDRLQGPYGRAGNTIFDGIEYDRDRRVVAYHLFDEHPGSAMLGSSMRGLTSSRVEASRVAHLYRADRPGQRRGVSWFAPVLDDLAALADNDEAQLMRQKIAACFSVFWRTDSPTEQAGIPTSLAPGLIQKIGRDDEVSFANPPDVTGYDDFARVHLRRIAAGLGITYEDLTQDLGQVNFSSARLGRIGMGQNVERWQWHMMLPRLCAPIGSWILKQWVYDRFGTDAVSALSRARIEWTPPPPVIADPRVETDVAIKRIEAGLSSRRAEIRKTGYEPAAIDAEIAADMETRRDLAALKAPGATPQIGDQRDAQNEGMNNA